MFMSLAASTRTQAARFQRLVGFVRRLIGYGRELAASFQRGETPLDPADPRDAAYRFGTRDLRIVLARIARGLLLAEALEIRLARRGNGPGTQPPTRATACPSPARASGKRPPRPETDREPDPDNLPTAESIAEAVRHRQIGAVLADIRRDFGITPNHPAWQEAFGLLISYGGQLAPLIRDVMARMRRVRVPLPPAAFALGMRPVCTGPPWPAPDVA
jgi:hypothetical protein